MDALDQKLSTEISEIKKMLISLYKHQVEDRDRRSFSEVAPTSIQQQQQHQQPKVINIFLLADLVQGSSDDITRLNRLFSPKLLD